MMRIDFGQSVAENVPLLLNYGGKPFSAFQHVDILGCIYPGLKSRIELCETGKQIVKARGVDDMTAADATELASSNETIVAYLSFEIASALILLTQDTKKLTATASYQFGRSDFKRCG